MVEGENRRGVKMRGKRGNDDDGNGEDEQGLLTNRHLGWEGKR